MPAEGAVVVSSAGGRAVTDGTGGFRFAVYLPAGAERVQVTAVMGSGTGTLVASGLVDGLTRWGETPAGTLFLVEGGGCEPSWVPTFGPSALFGGLLGGVRALASFDDGTGSALYAGGTFVTAGSVTANGISKWDGSNWTSLGGGVTSGFVSALTVFDDGSGPALYVGGYFTAAGDVPANGIAKWDGSNWSVLGSGVGSGFVNALAVFDDGSGPALYAGGIFNTAGGAPANSIAKWDGSNWSVLGSGVGGFLPIVNALTVFDDGSGAALHAAGYFTTAGGLAANRIAKWDGTGWSTLDSGMGGTVYGLTVFDDGGGPALYAGGGFTTAGDLDAKRMAKWDGLDWSTLGSGVGGNEAPLVNALAVFDDGSGPALFAGGTFITAGGESAQRIAKWDGTAWSPLFSGISGTGSPSVNALAVFNDGGGSALYAGGDFSIAGGFVAHNIATWNGEDWSAVEIAGMNGSVKALGVFNDSDVPALYVGGDFTTAGGKPANRIARWDGASWAPLTTGVTGGDSPAVRVLSVFNNGGGVALYAGGDFNSAGGVTTNNIAMWDGATWRALDSGISGAADASVRALTVYDDGTGPALCAGGSFSAAGFVAASNIAAWDGLSWRPLGSGLGGSSSPTVHALAVFDDGSGPALYAGGEFGVAGGVAASNIARWDGATWSALDVGMDGTLETSVLALAVFDDGGGPALFAGGSFTVAGGVSAFFVSKWNGTTWSALGSGMNSTVRALSVFDDGTGKALYVGGDFSTAGGVAAQRIARWNGTAWSALGGGMNDSVSALAVFNDGGGQALFAGGDFTNTVDSGDGFLAKWGCPAASAPWTDLGQALAGQSGAPTLEGTGSLLPNSQAYLLLMGANPGAPAFFIASSTAANMPFKGGILVPSPTSAVVLVVDDAGQIALPVRVPVALPSGSTFYMQYWIQDPGGPQGFSASNGLLATLS